MKKLIYLLLVSSMFCSCSNRDKQKSIVDIAVNDTLFARTIKINQNMLLPTKVFVVDNKIVVYDQVKDNIFKVFKLPGMEHLYNFGRIGKGPNEFISIDDNSMKAIDGNLIFRDTHSIKILEIGDDSIKIKKSKQILVENAPVNRLQMLNDSIYIADVDFQRKSQREHQMVNINSKKIVKEFGDYPREGIKFKNEIEQYQAFIKAPIAHPSNNKFAVFYLYYNLLKIYNNGELSHFINIDHKLHEYSPEKKRENIIYRSGPVSNSEYIYVLYIEKSKKEIEDDISSLKPKIEVWNWNGDLLAKYKLDKPIISFSISKDGTKFYGISFMHMDEIYEFDMPEIYRPKIELHNNLMKIENNYFEMRVPSNTYYAKGTPEQEKNKLVTVNGYLCNSNILIIPDDVNHCGLNLWISIFSNKNNLAISEFTKIRDEKILSNGECENYKMVSEKIKANDGSLTTFMTSAINSKGDEIRTNHYYLTWKKGKYIVEMDFGSDCRDHQENLNSIDNLVSSFSLKENINF